MYQTKRFTVKEQLMIHKLARSVASKSSRFAAMTPVQTIFFRSTKKRRKRRSGREYLTRK